MRVVDKLIDSVTWDNPVEDVINHWWQWDPDTAPYAKFRHYNPYIGFLFTAGLEVCHHYLTYARYSGDEAFLHEQAYPVVRDVCAFVASLVGE